MAQGVAARLQSSTPAAIAKLGQLSSAIHCPLDAQTLYLRPTNLTTGGDLPAPSSLKPVTVLAGASRAAPPVQSVGLVEKLDRAPKPRNASQQQQADHKARVARAAQTAGSKWFDMPATEVTPEVAQNLKLLKVPARASPAGRALFWCLVCVPCCRVFFF